MILNHHRNEVKMTRVIGVRFRTAGKIYFFDPGELEIKRGSHVIVETARGIEYGTVVAPAYDVEDEKVVKPSRQSSVLPMKLMRIRKKRTESRRRKLSRYVRRRSVSTALI